MVLKIFNRIKTVENSTF